jgi:hypothetical protein
MTIMIKNSKKHQIPSVGMLENGLITFRIMQKVSSVNMTTFFLPEAEFLDAIGTKILRVFLLAIHSHLYGFLPPPSP